MDEEETHFRLKFIMKHWLKGGIVGEYSISGARSATRGIGFLLLEYTDGILDFSNGNLGEASVPRG